jgi:UDP-2,3-diacylglucosamine pyrophosphatase LpxH
VTCEHSDRPKHAHGLCRGCYDGQRRGSAEGQVRAERPSCKIAGDTATVITEPTTDLGDLERLIRERGLDPEDWEVVSATLNEWDGPVKNGGKQKLRQLKIQLKRRQPLQWLFPATDVAQRDEPYLYKHPLVGVDYPQTIALLPDPHCPYQDLELEKRVHALVDDLEPDRVICLGDVCDFSSISRHRDNPAWFTTAQENIQEAFAWWSRLRDAAPDAEMDWIEGNHDARIRNELLTRAERMYGIKPAAVPGEATGADALSLERLCHLDRLRVNWVGPDREGDGYQHAGIDIGPELHARHGFLTGANSTATMLDAIGMSVVLGHTHRQDVHHRTIYRGKRALGRIVAVECGTLASLEGGMGYAVNPKWQQGLAVATVWPDGSHDVELVPYDGKALYFRGRRF